MIVITGKWIMQGGDLTDALAVRKSVFGRGADALDDLSQSVVVYDGAGLPAGAARLYWQEGAFRVDTVGVLEALRGQGYGDLLMRLVIYKAQSHSAKTLILTPTEGTRAFFARYGFSGDGEMALAVDNARLGCGHTAE